MLPPARFSSHRRLAPVLTAWRRCCVPLLNSTRGKLSSLRMCEVLTTPSAARPYLPSYATPSVAPAFYPSNVRAPPLTCGGTTRDECTRSEIAPAKGVEQGWQPAPGVASSLSLTASMLRPAPFTPPAAVPLAAALPPVPRPRRLCPSCLQRWHAQRTTS